MTFHVAHCKYIGRIYYDILSCLIYHRNFIVFCTADGWVQPMVAVTTAILLFPSTTFSRKITESLRTLKIRTNIL